MKSHIIGVPILLISIVFFMQGCKGCSPSGIRDAAESREFYPSPPIEDLPPSRSQSGSNVVSMTPVGGVYQIPITINGHRMYFIFDTGASSITISLVEAMFLKRQGSLQNADILGQSEFMVADGSIHEGTIINLREVQIGNRTLNDVEALVIANQDAPLLLGQSALQSFGRVTIDYQRSLIIFD